MIAQIDVTYITSKIIGLTFPDDGQDQAYKSSMQNVAHMLTQNHIDKYMIINLSERKNEMHQQHKQVIDFGWPENLAPPLERLVNICKSLDQWLNSDQQNIVVLHCKGGLSRLAIVLTAYINFCRISPTKEQNLYIMAMQNFCDEKLSHLMQPSQYRYVYYFSGLLSGAIRINNSPLFLHQIIIRGVPNCDGKGGCYPYFKIYQGMQPVYMSGVLICSVGQANICVTIEPALQLRSDIIIKCFNRSPPQFQDRGSRSEMIFRCQFHTCAIVKDSLKFMKQDLDLACNDDRFPKNGQLELVFSTNQAITPKHMYECLPSERNVLIGSSNEPLGRCNSYENFAGPSDDIPTSFISNRSMNGEISSTKIRHNQQQYQHRNEFDDIFRKDRETGNGYNMERSGRGGVEIRSERNQANYSARENYSKREEQQNIRTHSQQNNWDIKDLDHNRENQYEEQRRIGDNRSEGRYNEERMTNDFSKMHVTDTVQSHNDFVRSNTLRSSKQGRPSFGNELQPPSTRGGGSVTPSREAALLMPQTFQKDAYREQDQLDDILHELLDKPDIEVIRPDNRYSEGSGPLAKHGPVQGTLVNEGDNMRSVLTWSTDRRGDSKSAGVTRNTIAAPEPGVKIASETSRYREVSAPGANVNLFADRMATEESYEKKVPGYRESKQSKVTSQAWIQDNSKSVPFDDFSDGTASQRSRNRTYSTDEFGKDERRRYAASDTEEMNAGWLEKQRGRIRSTQHNGIAPEERRSGRNLRGEPSRRKEPGRAQSDMEDGEVFGYKKKRQVSNRLTPSHSYEDGLSPGRRQYKTVERETFTRRYETTSSNVAGQQSNMSTSGNQLCLPAPRTGSASGTSPSIPDRDESSRDAYLRSQMNKNPENQRSTNSIPRLIMTGEETEIEMITLQPIGPGVQELETNVPSNNNTLLRPTTPSHYNAGKSPMMPNSQSLPQSLSHLGAPPTNRQTLSPAYPLQNSQLPSPMYPNQGYNQIQSPNQNFQPSNVQRLPPQQLIQNYSESQRWTATMPIATLPPQNSQPIHPQLSFRVQPEPQHRPINQYSQSQQQLTSQLNQQSYVPHMQSYSQQHTESKHVAQNAGSSMRNVITPGSVGNYNSNTYSGSLQNIGPARTLPARSTTSTDVGRPVNIVVQDRRNSEQILNQQRYNQTEAIQVQHAVNQRQYNDPFQSPQHSQMYNQQQFNNAQKLHVDTQQNNLNFQRQAPYMNGNASFMTENRTGSAINQQQFFNQQTGTAANISTTYRSRNNSFSSNVDALDATKTPKYVRDSSSIWHRPDFTREDAIAYLINKSAGNFVIRNSSTYPGAYSLALKVAQFPSNATIIAGEYPQSELVRHFIIEPTARGVQLKGSPDEPAFGSLAAFVYQHSLTQIALPYKLIIPEYNEGWGMQSSGNNMEAVFNVLFVCSMDTESLTGHNAFIRALDKTFGSTNQPKVLDLQFKASDDGILLTDTKNRFFFKKHYPLNTLTYFGFDTTDRKWTLTGQDGGQFAAGRIFGFVARKSENLNDNACHIFADLDSRASQTIVDFVKQIMSNHGHSIHIRNN